MNKIFLALVILGAGTGGFVAARHSTINLQREASATRESWIVQTQALSDAQSESARLAERIGELKQNLRQAEAAVNHNRLWSVLETNRTGHLSPDLREHLLEELAFNWNSSEAFIVVSKETLLDLHIRTIGQRPPWKGKLTDPAAAALSLTLQERSQIETAMERVTKEVKDWAISHTERSEPRGDVLAQYTVQGFPAESINTNFFTDLFSAIGKERTELIRPYAGVWMNGLSDKPMTMIIKRFSEGDQQVLKASVRPQNQTFNRIPQLSFPQAFLPLFPNGWADVAEREGFELPEESGHK